uniref:hypothetical protein n=1 Tax=Bacillus glycinifermentans TaxID=1664069 RepID=UPI00155DD562|nr:hypothetical protein [Bacillus glycinifermentans]
MNDLKGIFLLSVSLFEGQLHEAQKVAQSSGGLGADLSHFIMFEYKLPSSLEPILSKSDNDVLSAEQLRISIEARDHLDSIIDKLKKEYPRSRESYGLNRSSLMRDILKQFILKRQDLEKREVHHSSFSFEADKISFLQSVLPFKERDRTIEHFILNSYAPSETEPPESHKPKNMSQIRIKMDVRAFEKLDNIVDQFKGKGLTRADVMRHVVDQLIKELSTTDNVKAFTEQKLDEAVRNFRKVHGADTLQEKLTEYMTDGNK